MRSAGLKNITAKHLGKSSTALSSARLTPTALASQSLSVVVALIPYIREFIRRHLNSKQAVMLTEFDKLKRVRPTSH
jgi:vacuolar protein sorting-associated protein 54